MWMALHFLCFSHTENKATGCLANRDIPWLPSPSAIRVITILSKQTKIPILPKSSRRIKDVFSSTQTLFSREQHKPYLSFRKFAEIICHSQPGVWSISLFVSNYLINSHVTTFFFFFLIGFDSLFHYMNLPRDKQVYLMAQKTFHGHFY